MLARCNMIRMVLVVCASVALPGLAFAQDQLDSTARPSSNVAGAMIVAVGAAGTVGV